MNCLCLVCFFPTYLTCSACFYFVLLITSCPASSIQSSIDITLWYKVAIFFIISMNVLILFLTEFMYERAYMTL